MYSIHNADVFERVKKLTSFYYYKFNIREPFNDVLNSIVLALMVSKYLERFDNSRPLHNYLSGYIYNHFCKVYKKEQYNVNRAVCIDDSSSEEYIKPYIEKIESSNDDPDDSLTIEAISKILDFRFPYHTFLAYNRNLRIAGIFTIDKEDSLRSTHYIIPRSAGQVFRMLYSGMTQAEIKNLLLVSKSWTSKVVSRIVSLTELREFARSKGFRVND